MKTFNEYLESAQNKRKIEIQNEEFETSGFGRVFITIFKHRKEIPTIISIMIAIIKHYYSSVLDYLTNNVDSFNEYKNQIKIKKLKNVLFKKIEKVTSDSKKDDKYLIKLYYNWEKEVNKLKELDQNSLNKIKEVLNNKRDNPIIQELLNLIKK